MTAAEIASVLEEKFGDRIKNKKLETLDPFVVVEPAAIVEVCRFLRDDPRLDFSFLNCISGVDYLEPDPKKAAKAGFDPHTEVVYHLSSFSKRHRFVLKVVLPRWKDDKPGQLPEVPSVTSLWRTAEWHEREVYDLSGVWVTRHPDLSRILLAENWTGEPPREAYVYPLTYHGSIV